MAADPAYSALWMHLLLGVLRLCDDPHPDGGAHGRDSDAVQDIAVVWRYA
jgi:hypothetical protein